MSLQAINSDGRLYAQERDIAHNFGALVQLMLLRMEKRPWIDVEEYLRDKGVTEEEISTGITALAEFVMSAKGDDTPMLEAMEKHGWLQANPHVHVAICAYLGSCVLGYYYQGIQEATFMGDNPVGRFPNLRVAAETSSNSVRRAPWWQLICWAFQDTFPFLFRKKKRA